VVFVLSDAYGFSPEEVERARRYHRPLYAALAADAMIGFAVLAGLTQVDLPLPWALEAAAAPALAAVATWAARLPLGWWRFRHERRYGFATQDGRGWAGDRLKGGAVGVVMTTLFVGPLLAAAHLFPHAWPWLAAGGGAALALLVTFVAPVVLEPVFNRFRPLEGELAGRLLALSERAGVPVREVLVADASRRTTKQNAYVSGVGRTRRVVLWDTLLGAPPEEIELVVAHELGHRRHRHVAVNAALAMAGVAAFVAVLRLLVPHPAPSDAALVLLLAGGLELVVLAPAAALSRRFEHVADRFSLAVTGDRSAYRTLHRRLALANLADLDPPKVAYLLLFSHPTPPERLLAAELALDRQQE
jgi:STE24 endopeptidase